MNLGLFGGSFDPVHYGHLLLAEMCREACALDEIWFIPAAIAPHKPAHPAAPASARLEMLRLAIGGHEAFRVSPIEVDRGDVSYTVDTLEEVHAAHPEAALHLLMGSDSLADLPTWRHPARICEVATLAVVHRAGTPPPDFAPLSTIGQKVNQRVVEMPGWELSSREIRRRIASDLSIRFQTPRAVEEYIKAHKLYAP